MHGDSISKIFRDERGAVLSIEMAMLSTIAIIGLLAGLSAYRDALVQELGDTAAGVASLQQSFSIEEIVMTGSYGSIPYDSFVSGSSFEDATDFCEDELDPTGRAPMCIEISADTVANES